METDALPQPAPAFRRPAHPPHPLLLALCVVLVSLAGFGGYRLSEHVGMQALRVEASHRLDLFAAAVDAVVNRYAHLPATVELSPEVNSLLRLPGDAGRADAANRYLERLNHSIGSIAIFILDANGHAVAASNWNQPDSFVGEDLSFRPYFRSAMQGKVGRHFAIGTTRGDPGYFVSHPVMNAGRLLGVAVIKIGFADLDETWTSLGSPALIADDKGVVILTSVPAWLYTALAPLSEDDKAQIAADRLYNNRPIGRLPVTLAGGEENGSTARFDSRLVLPPTLPHNSGFYLAQSRGLPDTGWKLLVFSEVTPVRRQAATHAALTVVGAGFLILLLLVIAQRRRILQEKLEAQALLQRANAELEGKVGRRTRALTESIARLRKEIAERQHAEQTLRAAQDELVQAAKLAVLGRLATGITHELNQPLGAMRTLSGNAIEFIRRGDLATAEKNLGIIGRLIDQMGGIITPLKTFARKSPAVPARVDVAHAVANALFLLDQRLKRADITVHNGCEPGRAVAWCDQNRLEQVLVNLISNAIDAMRGQAVRELDLGAYTHGDGRVVLRVGDTGVGLPTTLQNRLFEPFFTTKPAGEGLGLGLAISRDIVREFGGDLVADNRARGGAFFTVFLPAAPEPPAP
ncbi:sensor histidine kinase [Azoarcus indigens]|uniref:C4-dicarboxylate transport sensor protein DctB n=1 Tax=Azoarcus indigens TaxID=29545 RepID=A0A4R6E2V0_9RHOO|nr:ATP-binding protein [Azoarcus indigens]NMG65490.1 sensor histidine kinase [Azoarcus indigens]TDN51369.1 two-component system C4-dicarboxylate transport sensor histidine kinase DctB [Azoarcus indigens]